GRTNALACRIVYIRDHTALHDVVTSTTTLLRTFVFPSRAYLPERHGHAGPELATPSAQCIGIRSYRYTVVPIDAQIDVTRAARIVREWLSAPMAVLGDGRPRSLMSFVDPATPLVLTSLRAGPDGTLVVRIANPEREEVSGTLRFDPAIRASAPVALREGDQSLGNNGLDVIRTAAPLDIDGSLARANLAPYEIATWIVQLA